MRRLTVSGFVFAASFAALLWGAGAAVERLVPWQQYQDPRERLLWDAAYDGSPIVMLGDSEFSSFYVDRPDQTLWARLARLTGVGVYPGALNGAKPDDLLAAGRVVAANWPAGTTVYIDVPPTRFVVTRAEEPPIGNYPQLFLKRYGIAPPDADAVERIEAAFYRTAAQPFFLVRNRDVLANLVDRPEYFGQWSHHNIVWSDDEAFSRGRFTKFEADLAFDAPPKPFTWMATLSGLLRARGLHPVLVFTPANVPLIEAYAGEPERIKRHLHDIRAAAVRDVRERGIEVLDLDGDIPSACFADLVHTNVCGDEQIARRLAAHFRHMMKERAPRPAADNGR